MSDKYFCKNGVLLSPDYKNGGVLTPFFLKSRTKDIFTSTKKVDIFTIEEYADKVILKTLIEYSDLEFYDTQHLTGGGSGVMAIMFPFTFANDETFLPQITLRMETYNSVIANAGVTYIPIYANTSKDTICGIKIVLSSVTGNFPSPSSDLGLYVGLEISGTKIGALNYTIRGAYRNSICVIKSPTVEGLYYMSLPAGTVGSETEIVFHRWRGVNQQQVQGWLDDHTTVDVTFYYDEERGKMLIKYKTVEGL